MKKSLLLYSFLCVCFILVSNSASAQNNMKVQQVMKPAEVKTHKPAHTKKLAIDIAKSTQTKTTKATNGSSATRTSTKMQTKPNTTKATNSSTTKTPVKNTNSRTTTRTKTKPNTTKATNGSTTKTPVKNTRGNATRARTNATKINPANTNANANNTRGAATRARTNATRMTNNHKTDVYRPTNQTQNTTNHDANNHHCHCCYCKAQQQPTTCEPSKHSQQNGNANAYSHDKTHHNKVKAYEHEKAHHSKDKAHGKLRSNGQKHHNGKAYGKVEKRSKSDKPHYKHQY